MSTAGNLMGGGQDLISQSLFVLAAFHLFLADQYLSPVTPPQLGSRKEMSFFKREMSCSGVGWDIYHRSEFGGSFFLKRTHEARASAQPQTECLLRRKYNQFLIKEALTRIKSQKKSMFAFFSVLKEAIPVNTVSSGLAFLTLRSVEPGVFHNPQETGCGQEYICSVCVCVCLCDACEALSPFHLTFLVSLHLYFVGGVSLI